MSSSNDTFWIKATVVVIGIVVQVIVIYSTKGIFPLFILSGTLTFFFALYVKKGECLKIPSALYGVLWLFFLFYLQSDIILKLLLLNFLVVVQVCSLMNVHNSATDVHVRSNRRRMHKHRYDRCRCGKRR